MQKTFVLQFNDISSTINKNKIIKIIFENTFLKMKKRYEYMKHFKDAMLIFFFILNRIGYIYCMFSCYSHKR